MNNQNKKDTIVIIFYELAATAVRVVHTCGFHDGDGCYIIALYGVNNVELFVRNMYRGYTYILLQ